MDFPKYGTLGMRQLKNEKLGPLPLPRMLIPVYPTHRNPSRLVPLAPTCCAAYFPGILSSLLLPVDEQRKP